MPHNLIIKLEKKEATMSIEYREPTKEEMSCGELARLVEQAERHVEGMVKDTIGSEFELSFRGLRHDDYVLVAYDTDEEEFAGFVMLKNFRDSRRRFVFLDNLYVKCEYRGHGIRGELVRRVVKVAREAGKKVILDEISRIYMGRKFWRKFKCLMPYFVMY